MYWKCRHKRDLWPWKSEKEGGGSSNPGNPGGGRGSLSLHHGGVDLPSTFQHYQFSKTESSFFIPTCVLNKKHIFNYRQIIVSLVILLPRGSKKKIHQKTKVKRHKNVQEFFHMSSLNSHVADLVCSGLIDVTSKWPCLIGQCQRMKYPPCKFSALWESANRREELWRTTRVRFTWLCCDQWNDFISLQFHSACAELIPFIFENILEIGHHKGQGTK